MPMKKCIMCESEVPKGSSKYCSKSCHKLRNAKYAIEKRIEAGDKTVGLGKGGSNLKGPAHEQFSSGMGNFYAIRKVMKETVKHCNRCDKDLTNATRYEWCVHHKDHDRTNNVIGNFEMLCKRCHQVEHECHKAFRNN